MDTITIQYKDNTSISVPRGTRIDAVLDTFSAAKDEFAAVKINNEILPLSAPLEINAFVEPVLLTAPDGVSIYRRSLAFLAAMAGFELFPGKSLQIGHSLGHSYYYTFEDEKFVTPEIIQSLSDKMHELAEKDLPIDFHYVAYNDALNLFEKNHQVYTALLLDHRSESKVPVNSCGDYMDLFIGPLVARTGILHAFELTEYENGFLLKFPASGKGNHIESFEKGYEKIFSVYEEYKKWGRIVGVHSVGQLNQLVTGRTVQEYIRIAEAFQANKLAEVAAKIYEKRDSIKVILIAGPSSSGKTTTAKKLSIQLKVMGIEPIAIGLDDYYVGTEKTPKDEHGKPDFECLEALDVPYLNEQLLALLQGEEVEIPSFDFKSGKRREGGGRPLKLNPRSMLIIEGIHGLNDNLTPQISADMKFKLYVSALTQLNLDDHNRIPTSDNRLLRRMVRDYQFRGASAAKTISMWPSVKRGERKHIFPFQNSADIAFNSALDYELAVLKFYAEPLLRSVKPNMIEYSEAVRLLSFLENFAPIPPQYVPTQSILREFIGDSEFKY
jgi:uridine kinase